MKEKARIIAFYLPQFHPIPENDEWWGKGFTEWTNVGKAKKLFRGHYQPRVPADLGYYDLRLTEVREQQAQMARENGIEGFCYWHYWFGNGKQLLDRQFKEVVASGEPNLPFCLAWANESWRGLAHGLKNRKVLIEQQYPGEKDYEDHFYALLPAFRDSRYITVDGKPLFFIYKPLADNEVLVFIDVWRRLARENGLAGIYFVGHCNDPMVSVEQIAATGVDAVNTLRMDNYKTIHWSYWRMRWAKLLKKTGIKPVSCSYKSAARYFLDKEMDVRNDIFPTIISGWDHTPRSGNDGFVLTDYTPEVFKDHVEAAVELVANKSEERKIVMLKSWNEWAEGNYVEPDLKYGNQFLAVIKQCVKGK